LTKYKYSPKVGENGFVTVNVDIVFLIFIVLSRSLIFSVHWVRIFCRRPVCISHNYMTSQF